ncbi:putative proline dehydrogenase [Nostocoides japonicum T1-X7]|uniref:proline dehydrogenase n=1 Tax=Nostocoides japonicum T1-X7 TaxID=1194083 RepID=A0A077LY78_9MICO|nr:proline dehydrogenase family protein [Tetrasphaera japonica]CCH78868.1 putative proline dehydrogenase [Tetrasphaera japonica T1-X7]
MSAFTLSNPARPVLLAAARSERLERMLSRSKITRSLVSRFIPGEAEEAVMEAVGRLLAAGHAISVDYLGEDISHPEEADRTVAAYVSLLEAYRRLEVPATDGVSRLEVSIKLSALGQSLPGDGEALALRNARTICAAAETAGAWVNVDAEDHTTTDSTLGIVRELRKDFPSVATVLQAYLHRTEADCRDLAGAGSRIRLCKGAYKEPAEVAFQGKEDVDAAYLRCLKVLMEGDGYPMVASHDPRIIEAAQSYAREAGRSPHDFEIQMLYGIRPEEQDRLVGEGLTMRTYVPFGDDWYGYFMRRLAERPANLVFFLRSLVGRK